MQPIVKAAAALAAAMVLAVPAAAHVRHHHHYRHYAPPPWTIHHPGRLVPLLVDPAQGRNPAGTTWHDYARWGQPPRPTGTWARSQDGENWQPVDTYDVVVNGEIVGRDPDPNIRFQLMRESMEGY